MEKPIPGLVTYAVQYHPIPQNELEVEVLRPLLGNEGERIVDDVSMLSKQGMYAKYALKVVGRFNEEMLEAFYVMYDEVGKMLPMTHSPELLRAWKKINTIRRGE